MQKVQILITWILVTVAVLGFFYFCNPTNQGEKKAIVPLLQAPPAGVVAGEETVLGSAQAEAPFRMEVVTTTTGAGVERVRLNEQYYAERPRGERHPLTLMKSPDGGPKAFATTALRIAGGQTQDLTYVPWKKVGEGVTEGGNPWVEYAVRVRDASGREAVRVVKRYELVKGTYDLLIGHRLENLTDQALQVALDQMGPLVLPNDSYQMDYRNVQAARYVSADEYIKPEASIVHLSAPLTSQTVVGSFAGTDPAVWVASSNRFFTSIVRPEPRPGSTTTVPIADTRIGKIPLADFLGEAKLAPVSPGVDKLGLLLTGQTIQLGAQGTPTESTVLPLATYMGPKERDILNGEQVKGAYSPEYAKYRYLGVIHFSQGGMCGWCTFDWLAIAILTLLDWIHLVIPNYGVAIIILVIIVRLLLHPLTRYSQVSMAVMQKKMAAIQPELEAVKKRFAKDKAQQQQEIMKLYKTHNVNPASGIMGCLPMLLQMPIWIALYAGLAVDIDLRHATFIPGWMPDLSSPDTILPYPPPEVGNPVFTLPLMGGIYGLNLLPLLLTVVFFIQMKIMQKTQPPPADPDSEQAKQQAQMQKISQWMIMIFPVFLYNAPSGLNLYIFASTLGGIFDTWLVRRHMRAKGLLPAKAEVAKG